jgi:hypothetical protein
MAALVAAIHVLPFRASKKDLDGRNKSGHDDMRDTDTTENPAPHIRNTPNRVAGTGALSAAENASASTRRVSPGVMMPSSHSRAVA